MDKLKLKMSLAAIGTGFLLSLVAINSNAQVVYPGYIHTGTWQNWSGAYWGIYFGGGSGNVSTTFQRKDIFKRLNIFSTDDSLGESAFSDTIESSGKFHGDMTGSKADLFVGYNFNPFCTNFVIGGQLEGTIFSDLALKTSGQDKGIVNVVNTLTIGNSNLQSSSVGTFNNTSDYRDELHSLFSFVIRTGYLLTPSTLFYVLLGLNEGHFVQPIVDSEDTAIDNKRNKWEQGWTLGAGLEYQLTCHWFLRAEYRHLHFNIGRSSSFTEDSSFTDSNSMSLLKEKFNRHTDTDVDFNLGQVGLVYRF